MKKILSVIVVVVVTLTQTAQITAFAQETDKPAVNAQACVLYCVDDGKMYFSVNENKKNETCKYHKADDFTHYA